MSIKKYDERLVEVLVCNRSTGFKYVNVDPGDSLPVRVPISFFIDKTITTEFNVIRGITAQSLIGINQPLYHYGTGTLTENLTDYEEIDLNKLAIPNSVTKGEDGYYSVDYSKLDFTPKAQKITDII
tara:strand:- start:54 stop:434 length:381 start_codon:yes stop_codon:yes gene_type:complete